VLLSFPVQIKLLPSLGAVNGMETVDISVFKLRCAHIQTRPFLRTDLGQAVTLAHCEGLPLMFFCDGDLDVSTLFEFHIIAMFVC
jgi:hypothetical protein